MITHAFTCIGPYAILILLGIMRVENRNVMPVPANGRCAVSCSKSFCKEEFGRFVQWASTNLAAEDFERSPPSLSEQVTAADLQERSVGEVIATAEDAARVFRAAIPIAGKNEGFFVLPLDAERRALAVPILVSPGEASTTTVDPGEVFSAALQVGAKAIIVAHNHPSGNTAPSKQDRALTEELKRLGEILGVEVLDHLIVSPQSLWQLVR